MKLTLPCAGGAVHGSAAGAAWPSTAARAGGLAVNGGAVPAARCRPRDWPRAYYGANYRRLARVKAAYDPGRASPVPAADFSVRPAGNRPA